MKKSSFRLLKAKNRMHQKAWSKAQKFYIARHKKIIDRVKKNFEVELKTRVELQHQKDMRLLDLKTKEISELKKQIAKTKKQYEQYQELKTDLENVKSGLVVTFDSLFLTFGKLKSYFDRIDYVDFRHKKIKE